MAYCTLDANPITLIGEKCVGTRLNVHRATGNGVIIRSLQTSHFYLEDGSWYPSLRFQRLSVVSLQLNNGPITPLTIPDASSAVLGTVNGLLAILGSVDGLLLEQGGTIELEQGGVLQPE